MNKFDSELQKDYAEFLSEESHSPSKSVDQKVLHMISKKCNPPFALLFSKLLFVHLLSALFTLSVCPQFGFKFFSESMGLMKIFHQFGVYGCQVACGGFFVGTSMLLGTLVLSFDENRKLQKTGWVHILALVLISGIAFYLMDYTMEIVLTLFWFLGAFGFGYLMMKLGSEWKRKVAWI